MKILPNVFALIILYSPLVHAQMDASTQIAVNMVTQAAITQSTTPPVRQVNDPNKNKGDIVVLPDGSRAQVVEGTPKPNVYNRSIMIPGGTEVRIYMQDDSKKNYCVITPDFTACSPRK